MFFYGNGVKLSVKLFYSFFIVGTLYAVNKKFSSLFLVYSMNFTTEFICLSFVCVWLSESVFSFETTE